MSGRPYVVLSAAVSLDGALDDRSPRRLVLSDTADLDAVDALRASCDAILVGAGTVRADDPRLLVRSPARRAERERRGLPPTPARVVLTRSGDLDPAAALFHTGPPPLVYRPPPARTAPAGPSLAGPGTGDPPPAGTTPGPLGADRVGAGAGATVLPGGELPIVLADLAARGIRRLLVEGGGTVLAAMLAEGLADELRLAVAPLFVGDPHAPRFLGPQRRARLLDATTVGTTAVLRYAL